MRYEHKLPDDWGGYNVPFFTGKHRGVAVYATQGGEFRAVDATTGEVLYQFNAGTAAKSGQITYTQNGKQYVVQALGGLPGFGREEAWKSEFGSIVIGFTR